MKNFFNKPSGILLTATLMGVLLPNSISAKTLEHTPLFLKNSTNVISEPGYYAVQNSMKLLEGNTALLVQADNVHIDMGNQVLEGRGNDLNDPTVGIDFSGRSNVSVKNGTAKQFSTFGLKAETVDKIIVKDFCALQNGNPDDAFQSAGIFIGGTGDFGEGGTLAQNVIVKRVQCDQNFNFGLYVPHCDGISVCDSNFTKSEGSFNGVITQAHGLGFLSISPLPLAQNYTFTNINCNDIFSENTQVPTGAQFISLAFFGGFTGNVVTNLTFIDCDFSNNQGSENALEAEGCSFLNGNNVTFIRCSANNLKTVNGSAIGFTWSRSTNLLFKNCQANNQEGGSLGAGFFSQRNSRDVFFERCIANNNHSDTNAIGFTNTPSCERHQYIDCVANNNRGDTPGELSQIGFDIDGLQGGLLCNCIAIGNGQEGILVRSPDISSTDIVVKNCKLIQNGCFGILDTTNSSTNTYINNLGIANGGVNFELGAGTSSGNISIDPGQDPACTLPAQTNRVTQAKPLDDTNDPAWEAYSKLAKILHVDEILKKLEEEGKIPSSQENQEQPQKAQ